MRAARLLLLLLAAAWAATTTRPRRTLIFSINPGRVGSYYAAHVLNASAALHADHEVGNSLSGWALRQATLFDLEVTQPNRCGYVDELRALVEALPAGVGFADTTNMFVKTMADCVVERLGGEYDIKVVWLRRYLPAVLGSWRRHRVFDLPNSLGLMWNYTPHSPAASFSLTEPLCEWTECSPAELAISALVENEARGHWFRERYPHVPVVEARLEELATEHGARHLLERLGLPYDEAALLAAVGAPVDKLPALGEGALPPCDELRLNRDLVRAYQRRAARRGVALPPLPGLVPVNEACQAQLAAEPTDAELDAVEANWPSSSSSSSDPPVQLLSPVDGAVLTTDENGTLWAHLAIRTPFAHVPRPPLSVERHWAVFLRVEREGGEVLETFDDDATQIREAAIRWARAGVPLKLSATNLQPGWLRLSAGVAYYDVEDAVYKGSHRDGEPLPAGVEWKKAGEGVATVVVV